MKFNQEIREVIELALQVNEKTDHMVFVQLSPHVETLTITVYFGGYFLWEKTEQNEGTIKAEQLVTRTQIDYDNPWKNIQAKISKLNTELKELLR